MTDMQLNYSNRDFADVLADIKSRLTSVSGGKWTDFLDSDIGYALVKTFVGIHDMSLFYTDKQLAEAFLSTCSLRESAVRLAKQLNYNPIKITSSTVQARLTFPAFNEQIEIPADSVWTIDNKTFICESQIIIPSQQTSITISLVQGSRYTRTVFANGQSWFEFSIPRNCTNIVTKVGGDTWTAIDSFIDVDTELSYKLYENIDGLSILFGADLNTKKPTSGTNISVKAILSDGAKGNISAVGVPVIPITSIYDDDDNKINNSISGTTLSSALGGADFESIQSIKNNAPKFYGTQGRAVTETDYEAILGRIPEIHEAHVVGGEKIGRYGEVIITAYGEDPYSVSTDFINMIREAVDRVNMVTISVIVQPPDVVDCSLIVNAAVDSASQIDLSAARTQIIEKLEDYIGSLKIGDSLYESNVLAALKELDFVKHVNYSTTVKTRGLSQAGALTIPLISNKDLSACILKGGDGTTLFSGNGTSKIQAGKFAMLFANTFTDQVCKLQYVATNDDVVVQHDQLIKLVDLTINAELV